MSSIAVTASASGAGVISLQAPITATNRTITLPDATGTMATNEAIAAAGYTTPAAVLTQFNATGAAPVYACRAWVNFNGTGTVAIRASGNVSSITDNGTGDYTANFTTAMPDVNYCVIASAGSTVSALVAVPYSAATMLASSARLFISNGATAGDNPLVCVSIFR